MRPWGLPHGFRYGIVVEYRRLRTLGWDAALAFRSARTVIAFRDAESAGSVRFDVRPDEDPDLSWLDQPCFAASRAAERDRANRDGVWGIVGVSIAPDGTETDQDAVWGFIGEDWRDSGYDHDVMRACLDAISETPSSWEAL